mmetsp:Transcript_95201/g.254533  ORF Transcript_95201/g.254533 Transcript_95201/m.254533 type:complete len:385 (+) Transcript_95201:182-1336(+)
MGCPEVGGRICWGGGIPRDAAKNRMSCGGPCIAPPCCGGPGWDCCSCCSCCCCGGACCICCGEPACWPGGDCAPRGAGRESCRRVVCWTERSTVWGTDCSSTYRLALSSFCVVDAWDFWFRKSPLSCCTDWPIRWTSPCIFHTASCFRWDICSCCCLTPSMLPPIRSNSSWCMPSICWLKRLRLTSSSRIFSAPEDMSATTVCICCVLLSAESASWVYTVSFRTMDSCKDCSFSLRSWSLLELLRTAAVISENTLPKLSRISASSWCICCWIAAEWRLKSARSVLFAEMALRMMLISAWVCCWAVALRALASLTHWAKASTVTSMSMGGNPLDCGWLDWISGDPMLRGSNSSDDENPALCSGGICRRGSGRAGDVAARAFGGLR